ncbi:MAG: DNA polymerase III subunit delta [Acidobacteriota bacterium]
MPTGTLAELIRAIAQGRMPPIVVFSGPDESAKKRGLQRLLDAIPETAVPGCVERFQDSPLARVLDSARTMPLLGDRRVVIVRGAIGLGADGDSASRELLNDYMEHAPAHSVLVILAEKLDGRLSVVKKLEQRGFVIPCELPTEREMSTWLGARGKEFGVDLTSAACQVLADALGADTGMADGELRKLALLTSTTGGAVDAAQVEQSLGPSRAVGAFALEDALLAGDLRRALDALQRHLADNDPGVPLALLGRLSGIVRRLALAFAVTSRGGGENEVRAALGAHPFVAGKYARAAGKLGPQAERALAACVAADLALKSGRDARAALVAVVMSLAAPLSPPRRSATGRPLGETRP